MVSYFDHFIIVQLAGPYITDIIVLLVAGVLAHKYTDSISLIFCKGFSKSVENILEHFIELVKENLSLKFWSYTLPLVSLFFFILAFNCRCYWIYVMPGSSHIAITFGMAFSIWLGIVIYGFINFKFSFLSIFMPVGAPLIMSPFLVIIEIVSNLSRPVALGMRLAANITAGHILLTILSDFGCKLLMYTYTIPGYFPLLIIMFMFVLELGVLFIQAYVFTLLVLIYLKDSTELH
uniref:ATP synthase F0 subunit 6 n=1 Tax=Resomia ornicephala TaxID=557396 RepID=UPI0026E1C549|nr:ATP synthase F0 subunit 6 [Resomia ornicephala]WJJ70066.1 ATP synthase F0 subunit 6 [Resomia ornicephala]WJJ70078.1 ATP synthase F0 subunit 6 [Resomia ornicephala]